MYMSLDDELEDEMLCIDRSLTDQESHCGFECETEGSEVESDAEDDNGFTIDGRNPSTPIYGGAQVTVFESYVLAFQFSVRHSLTKTAFAELLQLISVHIPKSACYPKNVQRVKHFFLQYFPHATPKVHSYCTYCLSVVPSNGSCTRVDCPDVNKDQFISIPLGPQLKKMMEGVTLLYTLMYK